MATTLPAGPHKLASLIDIQPGAVVSRMLTKAKGGNVTCFAFDEGEGLSEHTTPFNALIIAVEGQSVIRIADTEHVVGPGEIIHLPADIPHAVEPVTAFKMLLILIKDGQ